ncbi:poly [ADP-ribose] polymerase 1 isoform X2 [Nymphaea colorata]|uniref:poly [ADP-ribose] polymerase 1 isoform X2 n=1 Tax=Nymphaea colorata TaxID=210225 RepID=UPI00129EA908|nr:poly [ADP-ribose] polymerase 1 isoform X2 [Nymphaea colorata]
MANPPKPWKAEYAKSSRSSCKTCKLPIDKDRLRLGKMVAATQFDGYMPMWNHAACILKKANQIKSIDDVEGLDLLRWEDQQNIRKHVEVGTLGTKTHSASADECSIEVSQTSRATCKLCNQKIEKGKVRVSAKPNEQGSRGVSWYHANCYVDIHSSIRMEELRGWVDLPNEEKICLTRISKKEALDNEVSQQSRGTKRKKAVTTENQKKVPKAEENASARINSTKNKATELGKVGSDAAILERKLEEQTKALWAVKDDLRKHVKTVELREMLEANNQDSAGSEYDLRERCADGMLFGALSSCPVCSGSLHYSGGNYRCHGYVSAWSKCSYSCNTPDRIQGKWKIPEGTASDYLCKWFKSQKVKKPARVLPPESLNQPSASVGARSSAFSDSGRLADLKVAIVGKSGEPLEKWKKMIKDAGGVFHAKTKKETSCLVVMGEIDELVVEVRKARRMKVPIVRENYLVDCIEKQRRLSVAQYVVESVVEVSKNEDSGHILEDGNSIYNTTLNMSDLSTGINSFYILQVIEDDRGADCFVFRKWGRIGNDKIGGTKLEEMSKSDAIHEFKRLFLEKTGNTWEAWEGKQNFEKQPGRFFPLEIDYGVNKQLIEKDHYHESQLAPRLLELMKMLFDVQKYRAAMMEFEINMTEMPLGKLSKSNIQKGFEALTEIQNLLSNQTYMPSMKASLIVDASNRFFTIIPSVHPHIIKDEDDLKSKVKMLEALQDMEIASKIVGFDIESDVSLDEKYKKLCCDIVPLDHDSADYQLVKKFLLSTHAPTHKDWALELEDVYALEREGELDKYAPYKSKLKNRMLLWHGSRLTNFVGILSQGLRIAPPEAPATGYMFGKGIYFADLVSKSAQYCYTDKKDPVGLMLLSEVSLGEMYELKKATYMERPPEGKHSTKGIGKTMPKLSDYEKWKDEVVVPCGKPVSSRIRASELMYNEYIVYNTSQVKMQFLLKVRFHHKR